MAPFSTQDLFLHRELKSLAAPAQGDTTVFIVSEPDRQADAYHSRLWALHAGQGRPFPLSAPGFPVASPVLEADGRRVAFLSRRESPDVDRVHVLPLDGGEAVPLTATEGKITSLLQWSGDEILALEDIRWTEDGDDPEAAGEDKPRVANFLPWKQDGSGPRTGKRTRLVALPVGGGPPRVLVAGDFDVIGAQLSPDGKSLACLRRDGGRQRHGVQLWLGEASGTALKRVECGLASLAGASWSPDGARLAFAATLREGDSLARVWLYEIASGRWSCPWPRLELEGNTFAWHPEGRWLATIGAHRGLFEVVIADVPDGGYCRVHAGFSQAKSLCAAGDRLLVVRDSLRTGSRLGSLDWNGEGTRRHGNFNAWIRDRCRLRLVRRRFDVPDGEGGHEKIDAWLLHARDAARPMPLLVDFHGGPQSVALLDVPSHVYWLTLCEQGWAVLMPHPAGSGSYGDEFARRLRGRWGELDLPQVEAVIRRLQRDGLADDRVACTGKSYGGYLAAWAIGHGRTFRAAVVSAPVSNLASHAGTSDSGYYVSPYALAGEIPDCRGRCEALSPVVLADRVEAATLFLQGEKDERCPLGQAEEMFAQVMRSTQAPARMVVYPGASHSLARSGRPSHRLDYHRRLGDWVRQWVAPGDRDATDDAAD